MKDMSVAEVFWPLNPHYNPCSFSKAIGGHEMSRSVTKQEPVVTWFWPSGAEFRTPISARLARNTKKMLLWLAIFWKA
jgi:hypothetical protein